MVDLILAGAGVKSSLVELRLLHQLLRRKWMVRLRHISKNQNEFVDHMVKYVAKGNFLHKMFEVPSISLRDLLIANCNGPKPI